jgi:hypothetical protein
LNVLLLQVEQLERRELKKRELKEKGQNPDANAAAMGGQGDDAAAMGGQGDDAAAAAAAAAAREQAGDGELTTICYTLTGEDRDKVLEHLNEIIAEVKSRFGDQVEVEVSE